MTAEPTTLCVCGHVMDEHSLTGQCTVEFAGSMPNPDESTTCPCAGFEADEGEAAGAEQVDV